MYKENQVIGERNDSAKVGARLLKLLAGRKYIYIWFACCVKNIDGKIEEATLKVGGSKIHTIHSKYFYISDSKKIKNFFSLYKIIKMVKIPIKELLQDETILINNRIRLVFKTDTGLQIEKPIKSIFKKFNQKFNFLPMKVIRRDNKIIYFRLTYKRNLQLTRREKEEIEKTFKFKILESKPMTICIIGLSKLFRLIKRKKINIYFEKFAEKCEEGTFEIFKRARNESKKTQNYFIISKKGIWYDRIKDEKNVIEKFSLKYYLILFAAHNTIASESQLHVNILRSANKALRRNLYKKTHVFLQHGIIFLKNLSKTSNFCKDAEGEPDYLIVSSEKEKNIVIETMGIKEDKILKTGIPMLDLVGYKHINKETADKVAIMLTWKNYEEHMINFEKTEYYKNISDIYELLLKYVKKENIEIILHPKVYENIKTVRLKEKISNKPISEIIKNSKLLITDYSSICYNSFYQGAGVIFYQPDLKKYEEENGKLIPTENEFIGKRAFNIEELNDIIRQVIVNTEIDLNAVRTKEHEEIYSLINEFSDGKNKERIYNALKELSIL